MERLDVIVYSVNRSQKLNTLLKTIFPRNKFVLQDLKTEELLNRSWYNIFKFLVVDCSGVNSYDKCINDIINEIIIQKKPILLISDKFELESLKEFLLEDLKIEEPDDNITVVKTADKINLISYKDVDTLMDKYDVILKLWDLSQCSSEEAPPHGDIYVLSDKKERTMEYISTLKWRNSKELYFQYSSLDFVLNIPFDKTVDDEVKYKLFTCLSKTKDKSIEISFKREDYFASLNTQYLGKVVLFSEVLTSNYTLMERLVELENYHPIVIISFEQTQGRGRDTNKWISPLGCAMFTFLLLIPVKSTLGNARTIIQQVMSISAIEAVNSICGIDENQLKLKWPNDIYWGKRGKLSGTLVKDIMHADNYYCLIGCGINVSNKEPTLCLYDIIEEENRESGKSLKYPSIEAIIGHVLTRMESNISAIQNEPNGIENFKKKFYKYWMHGEERVTCKGNDGENHHGSVIGIDNCGYLEIALEDNSIATFHPNGNSFDIVRNMIIPH